MWLPNRLAIVSCVLLAVFAAGCIRSKSFWQKRMAGSGTITIGGKYYSPGLEPPLILAGDQITNSVVGTETNESTLVSYGPDLQAHAKQVAHFLAQAVTETESFLGASLPRPHVYLLRLPGEPRTIQFSMSVPEAHNNLPWLMPLTNSASSTPIPDTPESEVWSDLRGFPLQISMLTHEITEMHLVNPKDLLVMGDLTGRKGFLKITFEHHTRWFRDGLAEFCALKASQSFKRQLHEAGIETSGMRFVEYSMRPFSELARVRGKLFRWDQNSKENYYAAATALFLLIERQAGLQAISSIVHELPKIKFPDGNALLKVATQKTGLDLRLIARAFDFPDLGLKMKTDGNGRVEIEDVVPESWGDHAKLRKGDILVEVNSRDLVGHLDFEMEILGAFETKQTLALSFLRNGARHIAVGPALDFKKAE